MWSPRGPAERQPQRQPQPIKTDYPPQIDTDSRFVYKLAVTIIVFIASVAFFYFNEPLGSMQRYSVQEQAWTYIVVITVSVFALVSLLPAIFSASEPVLAKKIVDISTAQRRKELQSFISIIGAMDGEDMGLGIAMAADLRNKMLKEGIDLSDPTLALAHDPDIILKLSTRVKPLQTSGDFLKAAPLIIWVHSLRAMQTPELRGMGREMWGHLQRGFAHAEKAAADYKGLTGQRLDIEGYDEFPKGLTPKPLD